MRVLQFQAGQDLPRRELVRIADQSTSVPEAMGRYHRLMVKRELLKALPSPRPL